ncbi:MAG: hypothetical protein ACK41V_00050 [Acidovorax sp.]|uniref:hypothetical protein n=1 Tax=Acidovorax sp. TaxID=1872122 RepID=UPI003918A7D0
MLTLSVPESERALSKARVEILAVFGAGKTTLAKRIAESDDHVLGEEHDRNPFWGDERAIRSLGYLGYDLSFLIQHAHLVTTAPETGVAICDWSFPTDLLWASLRLDVDLDAYKAVNEALMLRVGLPEAYLFLRQSPDTIIERLERRSRKSEASFKPFVQTACEKLEAIAEKLPSDRTLIVDDDFSSSDLTRWLNIREGFCFE